MREHDENTTMPIDDLMAKYPEIANEVVMDFVLSARARPMYQWGKLVDLKRVYRD